MTSEKGRNLQDIYLDKYWHALGILQAQEKSYRKCVIAYDRNITIYGSLDYVTILHSVPHTTILGDNIIPPWWYSVP